MSDDMPEDFPPPGRGQTFSNSGALGGLTSHPIDEQVQTYLDAVNN